MPSAKPTLQLFVFNLAGKNRQTILTKRAHDHLMTMLLSDNVQRHLGGKSLPVANIAKFGRSVSGYKVGSKV